MAHHPAMRFCVPLLAILAIALACNSKSDESNKKSSSANEGPVANKTRRSRRRRLGSSRRRLGPPSKITIAEAKKAVAAPAGARRLGKPTLMSNERVARTLYCFDDTDDVSVALERFTKSLKEQGWLNVRTAAKHVPNRRGGGAQKGLLRVAVMAQVSEFANCPKSKKHTRVSVSVYKLSKRSARGIRDAMRKRREDLRKKQAAGGKNIPMTKTPTTAPDTNKQPK